MKQVKLCFSVSVNSYDEIGGTDLMLKNGISTKFDDNCSGKENSIACITAYEKDTIFKTWSLYDDCINAVYYRIEFEGDLDKIYLDDECFEYCLSKIHNCNTIEEELEWASKIEAINFDFTKIKLQDIFDHNLLTEEQFKNNIFSGIVYNGKINPDQITRIDIIINRDTSESHKLLPDPQVLETLYKKEK